MVRAGSSSEHVAYFGDFVATACDLARVKAPHGLDSISFVPVLKGKYRQKRHEYLYWEFYEQGSRQAVRFGDWKAIREPMVRGAVKLFNLRADPGEKEDLAEREPKLVQKAIEYMAEAHVPDERWTIQGGA